MLSGRMRGQATIGAYLISAIEWCAFVEEYGGYITHILLCNIV
jgi:hypothetical protein